MEKDLIYDGLYGLAVADALGVPYESETLERMRANPCRGMVGFGHHRQPAGSWSDDTSMSLCVADSLCKGYDLDDLMSRFVQWRVYAAYTANGKVFDVGRICRRGLTLFQEGAPAEFCGDDTINGNGNGGLMRTFPIALAQCLQYRGDETHLKEFLQPIHGISSVTHGHPIGLICCGMFSLTLKEWLEDSGRPLLDVAQAAYEKGMRTYQDMEGGFKDFLSMFTEPKELIKKKEEDLPSWGYSLNTWNIALWSLLNTGSYRDCVLKAVNLGGDTDTNAGVAGTLAGVVYGKKEIPTEWLETLLNKELIDQVCERYNKSVLGLEGEKTVIDQFEGPYAFLQMKASTQIRIGEDTYHSVAGAYYALCVPEQMRKPFTSLDVKRARKLFKELPQDGRTEEHLYEAVKKKYEQNPKERQNLLDTAPLEIIYDTSGSHDRVLGRCRCKECRGKEYQNLYGKVLMRVREELKGS